MKKKGRKPKQIKFNEMNGNSAEATQKYSYSENVDRNGANTSAYPNTKFDLKPLDYLNQSTVNYIHSDRPKDDDPRGNKQYFKANDLEDPVRPTTNYISNNDMNDNNFNFENKNHGDAYILTTLTCNNNNNNSQTKFSQQSQHNSSLQTTNDFFLINELIERDNFKNNFKLLGNQFSISANDSNNSDTIALLHSSDHISKVFTKPHHKQIHDSNPYDVLNENKLSMMMIVHNKKGNFCFLLSRTTHRISPSFLF